MKLTNHDKNYLIRTVLSEVYKDKFKGIEERAKSYVDSLLKAKHPRYYELLNDKSARSYLSTYSPHGVRLKGERVKLPGWLTLPFKDGVSYSSIVCPYESATEDINIEDEVLIKDYETLWMQFDEAYSALTRMLNSYTTREKFLVDFPEYKDYLPAVEKAGLPAIVPSQIRGELSALGIPAKCEE